MKMLNIDKIIDEQLKYLKNIGCVVNIIDEEYEEEIVEEFNIFLQEN